MKEDYLAYSFSSLLAEVGGLAGIFLGASCLAAYDTVVSVVAKGLRLWGKRSADESGSGTTLRVA